MAETTALAKVGDYAVMAMKPQELREVISENIGDDGITQFDLDRIKVPTGGGTTWTVTDTDGNESEDKTVEGIIVFWKTNRGYWPGEFTGEGTPPQCSSNDGKTGEGDPGGNCADCPYNRFTTEGGKDCKEVRVLFVLREGQLLPSVLIVPPSSLKPMKKYLLHLASSGTPYYKVITQFSLIRTKNMAGIAYSEIAPKVLAKIPCDQFESVKSYRDGLTPSFSRTNYGAAYDEGSKTEEDVNPFEK